MLGHLGRLFSQRPLASAGFAALAAHASSSIAHSMRIEEETKLDYKDVLLRPKRSVLKSRSEVDLKRTFKFKHSGREWTGVPLVIANMDFLPPGAS